MEKSGGLGSGHRTSADGSSHFQSLREIGCSCAPLPGAGCIPIKKGSNLSTPPTLSQLLRLKKTDLVYGSVYQAILEFAKLKQKPFCVTELYAAFPPETAALNCRHLYESGRLVCIRKAETGRSTKRAVYQFLKDTPPVKCSDRPEVHERVRSILSKLLTKNLLTKNSFRAISSSV